MQKCIELKGEYFENNKAIYRIVYVFFHIVCRNFSNSLRIRSKKDVWKYINKYRKKKSERSNSDIQIDSWRDHFMEMLGGTRERATLKLESDKNEEEMTNRRRNRRNCKRRVNRGAEKI